MTEKAGKFRLFEYLKVRDRGISPSTKFLPSLDFGLGTGSQNFLLKISVPPFESSIARKTKSPDTWSGSFVCGAPCDVSLELGKTFDIATENLEILQFWNEEMRAFLAQERKDPVLEVRL